MLSQSFKIISYRFGGHYSGTLYTEADPTKSGKNLKSGKKIICNRKTSMNVNDIKKEAGEPGLFSKKREVSAWAGENPSNALKALKTGAKIDSAVVSGSREEAYVLSLT